MLTHLFNYIYNDCKQMLSFSWREKRNTEDNIDLGQGNRHIAYIIISDFSRVFKKKFDVTGQQISRHHTDHTHNCRGFVL